MSMQWANKTLIPLGQPTHVIQCHSVAHSWIEAWPLSLLIEEGDQHINDQASMKTQIQIRHICQSNQSQFYLLCICVYVGRVHILPKYDTCHIICKLLDLCSQVVEGGCPELQACQGIPPVCIKSSTHLNVSGKCTL